jgi:hypothetical protein
MPAYTEVVGCAARTICLCADNRFRCARRTLHHSFAPFAFFAAKILFQKNELAANNAKYAKAV